MSWMLYDTPTTVMWKECMIWSIVALNLRFPLEYYVLYEHAEDSYLRISLTAYHKIAFSSKLEQKVSGFQGLKILVAHCELSDVTQR